MDSLTQIVLGAAVGEVVLGKKLGNWSLLLGAVAGTLPDLDVFASWGADDPIRELQIHRAYSHSMFTHLLASIPLTWLSFKIIKAEISLKRWYVFWFLGLFTHALLDCGTTYGTRLLLPFTDYQVAFNNIAVIDPLYTLPFLTFLIVMMFYRKGTAERKKWLKLSLIVSSVYMMLTFGLKAVVHQKFKNTLQAQQIQVDEVNSSPTILNAILWSGIAYNQDSLYCAEYSFLNREVPIKWRGYPRNLKRISEFDCEAMQTVKWFGDGNYFVIEKGKDTIQFYTAKFGQFNIRSSKPEEAFMFYSTFYKDNEGKVAYKYLDPKEIRGKMDMKVIFMDLMDRIGIVSLDQK